MSFGDRRLDGEARVDRLVGIGRDLIGKAEKDRIDIAVAQSILHQRVVHERVLAVAVRRHRHFQTFEILQALDLAAVDQVGAHHDRLEAVAFGVARLVGDDLDRDAARVGVVEPGRGGARADVDFAGAERGNHLRRRIEAHERDLEALLGVIALGVGDEERRIARGADGADGEVLRLDAAGRRRQLRQERGRRPTICELFALPPSASPSTIAKPP